MNYRCKCDVAQKTRLKIIWRARNYKANHRVEKLLDEMENKTNWR